MIFNLAARFTFFTLLWWSWDQQLQETRIKMKMRRARKEMVEANAQALQSVGPAFK